MKVTMINTIKIIFNIMASINANKFLYFLKRIWLIGKVIPDTIYSYLNVKGAISILVYISTQIGKFFGKAIYLLIMVVLPIMGARSLFPNLVGAEFDWAVQILFIMNCLLGSILDSQIFNVTNTKYVCIKYMNMNPRRYVLAALIIKYVPFYIYYLIYFIIAALATGGTIIEVMIFWIAYICFRLLGEALQLYIYDRTEVILCRKNLILIPLAFLAFVAAYLPMYLGLNWTLTNILLHPISLIIYLAIGAISLYYIMAGYKHYQKKLPKTLDTKYMFSEEMKKARGANFADVKLKDKDLEYTNYRQERFDNKKGYSYLNALFFNRHHRLLVKPIYNRLIAVGITFLIGVAIYLINNDLAIIISRLITGRLPIFVFIMYLITVADKACRAMFYNCDISLLRYGFYRKPKTIIYNFNIRLIKISIYNIIIGGSICLAVILFNILCGTDWLNLDTLIFLIAIILLAIFFTVHHLFLYYVFQPYTTDLNIKNPFFNVINAVLYLFSWICFQIRTGSVGFVIGILIFTSLYIGVALILVYKLAPKSFRVK